MWVANTQVTTHGLGQENYLLLHNGANILINYYFYTMYVVLIKVVNLRRNTFGNPIFQKSLHTARLYASKIGPDFSKKSSFKIILTKMGS